MKKNVLILFLVISVSTYAQQQPNNSPSPNLQGLKIAYMTKELNLSSEDAQKFWPVYFSYTDEIAVCRKENKDDVILFDERSLAIRKKYVVEFKTALGTESRANKVFVAEREFGNFIKKELENRQKMKAAKQQSGNSKPTQ